MTVILVVDDEQQMRNMLQLYLRDKFDVIEASNGKEAINIIQSQKVDLVLLDVMMPTLDGMKTTKQMKTLQPDLPIILLTALNETSQKVEGLTIGADDYMVKPFDTEELIARIYVQLRHFGKEQKNDKRILEFSDWSINPVAHTVIVHDHSVRLSPKEFDLLYLLASNPERVFTREQLLDFVWGADEIVDIRTVDSHVRYVRDKLRKAGLTNQPIQTIWRIGYKFVLGDSNETK